jgi:hypothetical protein
MHVKIGLLILVLFVIGAVPGQGQEAANKGTESCRISNVTFKCPDYFVRLADIDASTVLFRYYKKESPLYFFVSVSPKAFDSSKIQKSVGKNFSSSAIRWKELSEVFMMNMRTKYEKRVTGSIGFDGNKLLSLISASFVINGKPIVLGYMYDTNILDPEIRFDRGKAVGDNASGCNAIVDTLNTITNEFPGEKQYCFLTSFGSPVKP